MLNNKCIFSKLSGSMVGGFPVSQLSTDIRFKDLVVPSGLYKRPTQMYNALTHAIIESSTATTINVDVFDTLLNNVSITRTTSNKTTRKKR